MIGIPSTLATKTDVQNCIALVQSGRTDAAVLRQKLEGIIAAEKVWKFKSIVDSEYEPDTDEKVIQNDTEYVCYELSENQNADFLRMGMTKTETQNLITRLGG